MFNGYHELSGTSYNELELDRTKKNQTISKWTCGNGAAAIQSIHLNSQNHQSEIWPSKAPFVGLANAVNSAPPKCNCPSCYQSPDNQSYQGDIAWHRSWFSRTCPVPVNVSHDFVKLQSNHQWESPCLPSEPYAEGIGSQYSSEPGEKSHLYKPYMRHPEMYQSGMMSSAKNCKMRKEDVPKQSEILTEPRYPSGVVNPAGYDAFRSAVDRRKMEDRTYCNPNEKIPEPCRQSNNLGGYHLQANVAKRTILEPFTKTVHSNANQTRVPSVSHRNIKDNVFHSYVDPGEVGKVNFYNVNQMSVEDQHCRALYQSDLSGEQDGVHGGVLNAFPSAPVDYQGTPFDRDLPEKELQKLFARNTQYYTRNNLPEVIKRDGQNFMINGYNLNRNGIIAQSGNVRTIQAQQSSPKAFPKFKDCSVSDKVSPDLKLLVKDSTEGYQTGDDLQCHISRPQVEPNNAFLHEKGYNYLGWQGCRRPEYPYRRVPQPYDYSNGLIRSDVPMTVNQDGISSFPEIRNGMESQVRVNSSFGYDSSSHQLEKLHYPAPAESKSQFVKSQPQPNRTESCGQTEKEHPDAISHLESIRQEELCKNGTSKISPLRLLRKKKFIHQKKEETETAEPETNSKIATPPLDVRRFWATWAEEEDENVPQTQQMVVLDYHNIDPEQAGLFHLYNEPIRTVHLEEGNVLNVKGSSEGNNTRSLDLNEKTRDVAETRDAKEVAVKTAEESKTSEAVFGMPLIVDSTRDGTAVDTEQKGIEMEKEANTRKNEIICDSTVDKNPKDCCKLDDIEVDAVLKKDLEEDQRLNEVKLELPKAEEANPQSPASSDSSDPSETGDLASLSDLPTSEYRKNKFLDYPDDILCPGVTSAEILTPSKDPPQSAKERETGDVLGNEAESENPVEIPAENFEIDDILQKLSDINFQSPDENLKLPESPDKYKTDKIMSDQRKDRKIKKSQKCGRSDQVTVGNISLSKPTIKFSIQKSHDLKISFKVLNNKKYEEEDKAGYCNEVSERGCSSDSGEEEEGQRDSKNRRRCITLKVKGLTEERERHPDNEGARRSRKTLKKKKVRPDRSPSPKTPVLKIKKSRYTVLDEGEEGNPLKNEAAEEDASRSSESESAQHDDFLVHETVDSAKIKLTFKRNKNGADKKRRRVEDETGEVTGTNDVGCLKDAEDAETEGFIFEPKGFSEMRKQEITPADSTVPEEILDVRLMNGSPIPSPLTPPEDITGDDFREEDPLADVPDPISETFLDIPELGNSDHSPSTGNQCQVVGTTTKEEPICTDDVIEKADSTVTEIEHAEDSYTIPQEQPEVELEESKPLPEATETDQRTDAKPESEDDSKEGNDCVAAEENAIDEKEQEARESIMDVEPGVISTEDDPSLTKEGNWGEKTEERDGSNQMQVTDQNQEQMINCESSQIKDSTENDITHESTNDVTDPKGAAENLTKTPTDSPRLDDCDVEMDDISTKTEQPEVETNNLEKSFEEMSPPLTPKSPREPNENQKKTDSCEEENSMILSECNKNPEVDESLGESKSSEKVAVETSEMTEKEPVVQETQDNVEEPKIDCDEGGGSDPETVAENVRNIAVAVAENVPNLEEQIVKSSNVEDEENVSPTKEKNNNNLDFIVDRNITRRCSCEYSEAQPRKVEERSRSLTIELTNIKVSDIPMPPSPQGPQVASVSAQLDIPVWEIPLPPGDPPPENCFNLEEYLRKKLSNSKTDPTEPAVESELKVEAPPVEVQKEEEQSKMDVESSEIVEMINCDTGQSDSETANQSEEVKAENEGVEVPIVKVTNESESPKEISNVEEECTPPVEHPETSDSVTTNTDDNKTEKVDDDVEDPLVGGLLPPVAEGTSPKGDQLSEYERLTFDESLAMADDMEEEKVSDDDKFRNMMQNCLDNAKKFLSVGSLKVFSCSVEDLLGLDSSETEPNKSAENHVSKDVLLTPCEESGTEDLMRIDRAPEMAVDFVPSFIEGENNLCPEILPVDNWPYLEEEVASSPVRNKSDDTDLLTNLISSEESTPGREWKHPVRKLNGRFRRISEGSGVARSERSSRLGDGKRRKTIEGVNCRWSGYRNSSEESAAVNGMSKLGLPLRREGSGSEDRKKSRSKHGKLKYRDKMDEEPTAGSTDYNSSTWQPQVVLFRISKSAIGDLMMPNSGSQREERDHRAKERKDVKDSGKDCGQSRREEVEESVNRIREILSRDVGSVPRERKKPRFRNLHPKRPESSESGKNPGHNRSYAVDEESDSEESSPEGGNVVRSTKSTREVSSGRDGESQRSRSARECDESRKDSERASESGKGKRKREDRHEMESQMKRLKNHGRGFGEEAAAKKASDRERGRSQDAAERHRSWVCEVCGFSKSSERAEHIQSHPFHCQSCHLAFKTESNFVEHLRKKHKDIRNQHHCLLCELSFDLEKEYYRHLETREHKHLESVEKNTINTLFKLLTGQPCPVLGHVESKPEWLPTQAGTVHFYHQATPLSLALQYLKLHHDKKRFSTGAMSPQHD